MSLSDLDLPAGNWVVANCGKHASEKNCKLVFLAPETQKEELLETVVDHAVTHHKNENSPQLKQEISDMLEVVRV